MQIIPLSCFRSHSPERNVSVRAGINSHSFRILLNHQFFNRLIHFRFGHR